MERDIAHRFPGILTLETTVLLESSTEKGCQLSLWCIPRGESVPLRGSLNKEVARRTKFGVIEHVEQLTPPPVEGKLMVS